MDIRLGFVQQCKSECVDMATLTLGAEPVPLNRDENGVIRVGGTRVTLDTVARAFVEGMTAEEIVDQYPSLRLADIYSVIAYILNHRADVDDYLREQDRLSAEVRREVEAKRPTSDILARVLSRKTPN